VMCTCGKYEHLECDEGVVTLGMLSASDLNLVNRKAPQKAEKNDYISRWLCEADCGNRNQQYRSIRESDGRHHCNHHEVQRRGAEYQSPQGGDVVRHAACPSVLQRDTVKCYHEHHHFHYVCDINTNSQYNAAAEV
jgi:hypothetical protein